MAKTIYSLWRMSPINPDEALFWVGEFMNSSGLDEGFEYAGRTSLDGKVAVIASVREVVRKSIPKEDEPCELVWRWIEDKMKRFCSIGWKPLRVEPFAFKVSSELRWEMENYIYARKPNPTYDPIRKPAFVIDDVITK